MPEIPVPAAQPALKSLPAGSWHATDASVVEDAFVTSASGLSDSEAASRLAQFGPNSLPKGKRRGPVKRFLLQFHNLLIYVLLGAAVISLLLGHGVDSAVILAVVLVNAGIGFIQEGRAEQALEAIRAMTDPRASVLRSGRRLTIAADRIVPGDIVLLDAGDRVAADLRLLRARGLKIEEAVLTGESMAIDKSVDSVAGDAPLGDRTCLAYSGSFVASGQGFGIAVGTALNTELGRISTLLEQVEELKTPLLKRMDGFSRTLTFVILGVSAAAFAFARYARDYTTADAFMAVVGVAVAAIPEGLPAIMTITLAIGVQRMAKRNAIIRRLPAVETLGSVSVICSDKTGTLTRNEMTVRQVATSEARYAVSGVGYEPSGGFTLAGVESDAATDAPLVSLVRAGLLCNDAGLRQGEKGWQVDGDPMEGALVALAHKAGLDPEQVRKEMPRTDEIPFDAAHRFMATLHHTHDDGAFILIKGAPERLLEMCSRETSRNGERPIDTAAWKARADALAAEGHRVLAFASKQVGAEATSLRFSDVEGDAVLLGIAGFIDPPREEAITAIRDCRSAGIKVLMITGDHAVTAREIARQLGLADDPRTLTGQELSSLSDAELRDSLRTTTVFARTTPEHKLRLVEALQAEGRTVAMTGDGVNDAPALKRADVGVAMGQAGTEVAKQAAEMVLADDNFASIVAAVREGRTVYDNLIKMIAWTLPTNGGEAMTILAALALGLALPITPVQILWINMITAVTLGLTLAFEPTEPGTMNRPPRPPTGAILSAELVWRVAFVSLLMVAGAFGMFFWAEARGLSIEVARTLVVNTLVVMEIFYLFSIRYVHGSSLTWQGVIGTPAVLMGVTTVVIAQFLLTYFPPLQAVFATRPLSLLDGAAVVAMGVALLIIVEAEKRLRMWIKPAVAVVPDPGGG